MDITINGKVRMLAEGSTLADLLAELEMQTRHLAIEHNGYVLGPEDKREEIILSPGDTLEIVRLVGGG